MSIIQALLLGLVQGLTEFLPVSSSGHLALIEHLFQSTSQKGLLFEVLLHIGTLVAILAAFRQDLKKLFWESCKSVYDLWENIRTYFHNRNHQDAKRYKKIISNNYRKLFLLLFVTTVPTVIEGLWLENAAIQARGNLLAPATGFFSPVCCCWWLTSFRQGIKYQKMWDTEQPCSSVLPRDLLYFLVFHVPALPSQLVCFWDSTENLQ